MQSDDLDRTAWEEYESSHPISVDHTLQDAHPVTRLAASALGWAGECFPDAPPIDWRYSLFVRVHHIGAKRVLPLLDAFLKACEMRGFTIHYDPKFEEQTLAISVWDKMIPIRFIERGPRVPYLLIEADGRYGKIWQDTPRLPLERKMDRVMLGLRTVAAERIIRDREWAEHRRKIAEMTERREELREEVEREQDAVDSLMQEADNWRRARDLRAYIAVVQKMAENAGTLPDREQWMAWAKQQADRLDPLTPSPPSILDTPYNRYRELHSFEILNEDGTIEWI